jgi:squalene-hopene/tetraprenyl-beta-curcumene cyclase
MRTELGESQTSSVERLLLDSVTKRVDDWDAIQPYLGDKNGGPGTESVLNALILAQQDSRVGHLSDTTRKALKIMWARQSKTGDRAGAWPWISAGNEPWEAPDSEYWGATLGAVAAGTAPDRYQSMPQIQDDLRLLKAYLRREEPGKSLLNRLGLLWACTKMPGLITADRRAAIISDALALQQPDGGWSTVSLIPASWPRRDRTPKVTKSDGYGTGMVAFVLEQAGVRRARPEMRKALAWLSQNQDRSTGAWLTASPNIARDASTDVGKFMTDAATAYAVLALSAQTQ